MNPFDPAALANPWPIYQALIARSPVLPVAGTPITLVLSYDLVAEAAGRVDDFSNDFGALMAGRRAADPAVAAILDTGWPTVNTLLTADPPVHTRYRKLVNLAFSMKRVDAIEARIRRIAERLADALVAKGEVDFVADFAVPLPVAVIARELGMESTTDVLTVKRWSDAFADRLGGMAAPERELECAREVVEFQHHIKRLSDERRATPTDDLLNDLVHARVEGERPLDDAEIMSIMQQLMVAGNETTTSTLAGGLLLLIEHPDQRALVEADRTLLPNMAEEMLRMESPASGLWRVVKRDCELGGVPLKAGTMLMLRWAAANRDPARFPDPDRFDVRRANARQHLAFGRGIHMCVGNMLSRREIAVAFDVLLDRVGAIELQPGATLDYPPNMLLRGLKSLPVRVAARPRELAA